MRKFSQCRQGHLRSLLMAHRGCENFRTTSRIMDYEHLEEITARFDECEQVLPCEFMEVQ